MIFFFDDIVTCVYLFSKEADYMKTILYISLTIIMLFSLNACLNQASIDGIAITNVTVIDAKKWFARASNCCLSKRTVLPVLLQQPMILWTSLRLLTERENF